MAIAIVTFARGWQALAIVRSLGRQGIEVYCGEEAPFAPCFFSKYTKGSFTYPSLTDDPEAFLDALEAKVRELRPPRDEPYVLMPVHKETWLIAKNRKRFEPHISMALTSHANMARTHDKGKLPALARELQIPVPPTHQFRSIDDLYRGVPEITFPVFLKVREGASGVGIKRCDTPEDLTASFKEFVEGYGLEPETYPLVQEFIDGDDYCVTALFKDGRAVTHMTYHNVRQFPRETGASALRETVSLPEAEAAAERLLGHLGWHGIAELDFRVGRDGTAYLIEINPRFFGGLSQAVASNVDYPYLLYRVACGEEVESPDVDFSARTEVPVLGLLATLDEIASDERTLGRLRRLRDEARAAARADVRDLRLQPLWHALREAGDPKDLKAFIREKLEEHEGAVDEILQGDDPWPALGVLYPLALMLKHGKVSLGLLTSEAELGDERPRRSFRSLLRNPRWRTLLLMALLYAVSLFLVSWELTRDNVGLVAAWPMRFAEALFGSGHDTGTLAGASLETAAHVLNLLVLYVIAALLLREGPRQDSPE